VSSDLYPGNGRRREVEQVDPNHWHLWLAGQVDEVEHSVLNEVQTIRTEVEKIRASMNRQLWVMVGILVSLVTSSLTLLLTDIVK
jgi:hypothetical protein